MKLPHIAVALLLLILIKETRSFPSSLQALLSSPRLLQLQQLKLNAADPDSYQFVESVDLSNWGVFKSVNVTLTNKPVRLFCLLASAHSLARGCVPEAVL